MRAARTPSKNTNITGGNRTLSEAFVFKYGALPDEFLRPKRRKTFLGVGVELRAGDPATPDDKLFLVADIRPGGPAARAGVRPLDRLLAVNGASEVSNSRRWGVTKTNTRPRPPRKHSFLSSRLRTRDALGPVHPAGGRQSTGGG